MKLYTVISASLIAVLSAQVFASPSRTEAMMRRQDSTTIGNCLNSDCSGGFDALAIGGVGECTFSGPDTNCVCYYIDQLSSGCTQCVLADSQYSQYYQQCQALGYTPAAPTGVSASEAANSTPAMATSTPASIGPCSSKCSGNLDQGVIVDISSCLTSDTDCLCSYVGFLSTDCGQCLSTVAPYSELEQQCASINGDGNSSSVGTSATSGPTATPTSTSQAPPSSPSAGASMPSPSTKSGATRSQYVGCALALAAGAFSVAWQIVA